MTIGTALLCRWKYGQDWGWAAVTASDRMLTRGEEEEYEPPMTKVCDLARNVGLVIAGDMSAHSEALKQVQQSDETHPEKLAAHYSECLARYRARQAESIYLLPLGLTQESLLRLENHQLAADLVSQMQNHNTGAEAIVAGFHSDSRTSLLHINSRGFVTSHEDVGFVSIGIGARHADSEIMHSGYTTMWEYPDTLLLAYMAKKRAEIAPGVGEKGTDMMLIKKNAPVEYLPEALIAELRKIHEKIKEKHGVAFQEGRTALEGFLKPNPQKPKLATSSKDQT